MDTFITEDRENFEEAFPSLLEQQEYERSNDLVSEFKGAIREGIGSTWLKMTWKRKDDHPIPFGEIEEALRSLADEIRQWRGVKTVAEIDRERMHKKWEEEDKKLHAVK